jgi:ribosomal protein S18 acetylase RimI-like enzyme
VRTFLHMQGPSDGSAGAPSPPDGVTFRAFRHDEGDEWATFHRVLEAAFADHFGAESLDLDTFVEMWTEYPSWDPALVTFAEIDGEVVGLVVGSVTANPGLGWINDLGVLEPFRGRGIAKALLLRSFAQLAARGCTDVRLAVDSENTTGATRLYERVGMGVQRRWDLYEKRLEPHR